MAGLEQQTYQAWRKMFWVYHHGHHGHHGPVDDDGYYIGCKTSSCDPNVIKPLIGPGSPHGATISLQKLLPPAAEMHHHLPVGLGFLVDACRSVERRLQTSGHSELAPTVCNDGFNEARIPNPLAPDLRFGTVLDPPCLCNGCLQSPYLRFGMWIHIG